MKRVPVLAGTFLLLAALVASVAAGPVAAQTFRVGMVTDVGGIDDKSFNATSWEGVARAIRELGVDGRFLESQQQTDYARSIQEFLSQKYDLIVTVGFLLGDATKQFAQQNPNSKFAIVDFAYEQPIPNVRELTFATDQAAFLAGYAAAGVTKTGVVGTFGGIPIPTVTIFMRGFEAGVKHYNQVHGMNVEVLGWNSKSGQGLFAGNFESTDDGRRLAEALFDEGADIVMPVAGPVGLGAAAAAKDRGLMLVGVDTDWYVSAPEFKETLLTSVMKKMDVAVYDTIKAAMDGTFEGGAYVGTLANDGVDIAPFHDYEDRVPASLKTELEQIRQQLIDGTLKVDDVLR
ncbi:BMP family lipoprotein [Limnochorda pilosa]|uniref:Membrane protein n=1 Tax=Limnochorda pilosa TaxID=1555112 RepID=A0A0K2SJ77_LIMPI|nr:BMP family ABC transporter substrate-binding protein [Limnochorda pilosa]BAS27166.1 membrane protein [Limnochorda pilosa]